MPLILLDTNIWVASTQLLRGQDGSTLLHHVHVQGARILLPEVVRAEIHWEALRELNEAKDAWGREIARVQRLMGLNDQSSLPSSDEMRAAVDRRLDDLRQYIVPIEADDRLLARAGRRVIDKRRPYSSSGNDSYKDCAIWESLLAAMPTEPVLLASKDKRAFFDPTIPKDKPAVVDPQLATEAADHGFELLAYNDIAGLLTALKASAPAVDEVRMVIALDQALLPLIRRLMVQWNVSGVGAIEAKAKAFTTEKTGRLLLRFDVVFPARGPLLGLGETTAKLRISGSCLMNVPDYTISKVHPEDEQLLTNDGTVIQSNVTVYAEMGSFGLGIARRPLIERYHLS